MSFLTIIFIVVPVAYSLIVRFSKKTKSVPSDDKPLPPIRLPSYDFTHLPYKKNSFLLTKAEFSFYKVLILAVNEMNLYVCPKVRLADIIHVSGISISKFYYTYFNKIQSKHIDFLLCRDDYLIPVLAIELDDSSHSNLSRVKRDLFLESALQSAKLPLLRIDVGYSYAVTELKNKIDFLVNQNKKAL